VLDLQTGGDLRYYMRKRYLFEEADVAFYIACLSSALEHMHSCGVIHRDVKPENIILDERGYPYLTDFGVAHVQSADAPILSCTLASGTRQYLAPEVFTKAHLHGPEADFWSLGVVAYELLFGRRPFDKHAPLPMINYLERALQAKRRQNKEKQMRRLASKSTDCAASSPILQKSESMYGSFSSDSLTPPRPLKLSSLPSFSHENTTGERGTTGTGYCSSVGFSRSSLSLSNPSDDKQLHTISSSDEDDDLHSPGSAGKEKGLGVTQSPSQRSRLPSLQKPSSLQTPPRPLFQRSASSSSSPQVPLLSSSSFEKLGMQLLSEEDDDTERLQPGDHWLVDEGKLPAQLRISIPKINPWLGEMSEDCLVVLRGLFEVRPSHRLGARNMAALKAQAWFKSVGCGDWVALSAQTFSPHFQPGKRFRREAMEAMGGTIQAQILGEDNDLCDLKAALSPEEEEQFRDFFHIQNKYRGLFAGSDLVSSSSLPQNRLGQYEG
jgi:serine/threonine protein kinase